MVLPCSPRLPIAAMAALLLSWALPTVSDAHGGEIHGERYGDRGEAPETESSAETVTPVPAEAPAEIPPSPSVESSASQTHSLTPDSLLQRSRLMATTLWQAQPLEGGEIVGALIFTAPFVLTFLKRRAQTKTAVR